MFLTDLKINIYIIKFKTFKQLQNRLMNQLMKHAIKTGERLNNYTTVDESIDETRAITIKQLHNR